LNRQYRNTIMYVLHSMRKENVVQEAQPMLTNPRDAFSRQSRSPNMVPFDMIGSAIVTLSLRSAVFEIFDFKKCRDLEIRVKGHPRSPKATRIDPLPDFLLTLHSNRGPILHRFRDRRRFWSKIAYFCHPRVFNAPAEWVPLGIVYRRRGQKNLE